MGIKDQFKELKDVGIKQYFRNKKGNKHDNTKTWFDVISYDASANRYRLDRTTIKEKEVPPEALAVTGEKHHYVIVACEQPSRAIKDELGFFNTCAISNYLYMKNNSINDAMASTFKPSPVNPKLLGIIAVGAVVIAYLFFMKM